MGISAVNGCIRRTKSLLPAALFAALLLCLSLIYISYGYFESKSKIVNTFQGGNNTCSIEEEFDEYAYFIGGEEYTKKVTVRNTGTTASYIRLLAETVDSRMETSLSFDFNYSDWTQKQDDGYYYYKYILEPGEVTEPLFTTITPNNNCYEFEMICYGESVQSDGFTCAQDAFSAIGGGE